MTAEERINEMKKEAEKKLFELRRDMENIEAKELTPIDGIELRQNLNKEYILDGERYVGYFDGKRLYIWDLHPEKQ